MRRVGGRAHEHRFREIEFARDRLHCLRVEPFGIEHDRERIARKAFAGENIERDETALHAKASVSFNLAHARRVHSSNDSMPRIDETTYSGLAVGTGAGVARRRTLPFSHSSSPLLSKPRDISLRRASLVPGRIIKLSP